MKLFIYMNERIRNRRTKGPVIVVQRGSDLGKVEGNMVVINGPSIVRFDPRGLPIADGHDVTAWIEADARDVVVR